MPTRNESSPRAITRDETTSSCGGGVPGCCRPWSSRSSVRCGMKTAPRQSLIVPDGT
jgi:hypothetical protein